MSTSPLCANHTNVDVPAVAVLIYHGPPPALGAAICASCASCTDTRCAEPGVIMCAEYDEPWCATHRDEFTGDETIHGPDIVPLGSARHLDVLAQLGRGGRS